MLYRRAAKSSRLIRLVNSALHHAIRSMSSANLKCAVCSPKTAIIPAKPCNALIMI